MRLGVFGINSGSTFRPADTIATVQLAEQLGFDSVWAGEHVVVPSPRVVPSLSVTPRRRLDAEALATFTDSGLHRLVLNTASDRSPADVAQRLRQAAALTSSS